MTTTADNTRKRKQEFLEPKPINTSWSDFVYSSPNSPNQQQAQDFNLDNMFQQQHQQQQDYDSHSRRHSVTVGEMHFHSFDKLGWNNNEIEQLLTSGNNSLPSSWSSNSSGTVDQNGGGVPIIHRRAMSLRLDNLPIHQQHQQQQNTQPIDMHRASISTASPTTPAFFSPSFLDALKHDDDMVMDHTFDTNHNFSDDLIHDFMMNHQQQQQSTITPSVISTGDDVNSLTNWLLNPPNNTNTNNHPILNKRKSSSSSSSLSTSPPIQHNATPSPPSSIQAYQQQHPSIPEEEDEDADFEGKTRSKQMDISSRIVQGTNNAAMMKSLIQKYLSTFEDERKVMILTSKVAQKSYGTEKRFLCPPPSTLLSGTASWWTKNNSSATLNPPSLVVHISGEKTSQNGVLEWYNTSSSTILDNSSAVIAANNGDTNLSGNCVSKHLHINDADEKRKRVEVLVKINLANGIHLGTLASKGIKVISKPSKKRQSVKNMELCIHHGTTISLFNRIRSQTVSTKYLGVSTAGDKNNNGGTCFVARTGSWDPFVIWIVDTTRSPDTPPPMSNRNHHPENPHFPAPPAIALQTTTGQAPIALHYNQAIVLQCVSTGLVSPVMVIRKVDKGSMIMGGNRVDDLSGATGGECGDEALGDPVSQLHKIAFQIVQDPSIAHNNKANYQSHMMSMNQLNTAEWTLPQTSQAVTYLACLNDVVGMHKTTTERSFVSARPVPPPVAAAPMESSLLSSSSWSDSSSFDNYDILSSVVSQQENGKVTRKRRVSCDVNSVKPMSLPKYPMPSASTNSLTKNRRRVNSLNDGLLPIKSESGAGRRSSISSHDRRSSTSSDGGMYQVNGACWTEDVSDASVWTIVGTDCASYKFWTPSSPIVELNSPFNNNNAPANPITPFPVLSSSHQHLQHNKNVHVLNLTGENFTRDISVWFGDIKARTQYKSRDSISCSIPDIQELMDSPVSMLDTNGSADSPQQHKIPILFVRGDGVIYNTDIFYTF